MTFFTCWECEALADREWGPGTEPDTFCRLYCHRCQEKVTDRLLNPEAPVIEGWLEGWLI